MINEIDHPKSECSNFILPIKDTLNVLSGKWKLPIIGVLTYGKKRFKELEREIPHVTPRMLSKELKELELNGLVKRSVFDTKPVSVEYELTCSGKTLDKVLDAMKDWGLEHRKRQMTGQEDVRFPQ